jgi:hypothetical protein
VRHDHRRGIQRIAATVDAVPFLTWCNLSSPDAALRGGVIDLIEVRLMCVGAGPTLDYESAVAFLAAFEPVIEQARRRSCNEGLAVPQTHGHIFRREPGFPSSGAGARGEAASKVRKATGGDAVGPASECQTAAPCTNRRCHCVVGSDGICRTYAVAPPPSASAFGAGAGFTGKGRFARSDHPPRLKKIGYKDAGQDADLGGRMDTLPIVETLKKKFTLHGAELKYLEDEFRFAWCRNVKEKLPEVHGVYCLFSHGGTRLQKVGKADGAHGLRGRFRSYTGAKTEEKSERDPTDRLWKTVMKGNLKGKSLSVYYFETPPGVMSIPFVLDGAPPAEPIKYHWARPLEEYLSRLFRCEHGELVGKTHMLLSGIGD